MPSCGVGLWFTYLNLVKKLSVLVSVLVSVSICLICFSPAAESFGVSAQIGSGVVWGGPEVRLREDSIRVPPGFHQGSTRVPPGFHQGSTRVPPGFHQGSTRFCEGCGLVRALKREPHAVGDITRAFFIISPFFVVQGIDHWGLVGHWGLEPLFLQRLGPPARFPFRAYRRAGTGFEPPGCKRDRSLQYFLGPFQICLGPLARCPLFYLFWVRRIPNPTKIDYRKELVPLF